MISNCEWGGEGRGGFHISDILKSSVNIGLSSVEGDFKRHSGALRDLLKHSDSQVSAHRAVRASASQVMHGCTANSSHLNAGFLPLFVGVLHAAKSRRPSAAIVARPSRANSKQDDDAGDKPKQHLHTRKSEP